MTTINPVQTPVTQTPAFKGGKKHIVNSLLNKKNIDVKLIDDKVFTSYKELPAEDKKLLQEAYKKEVLGFFAPKKLSPEQAAIERTNGMVAAYKIKDKEELKNLIINEALMGHKDFLEGVNEALAKGAAKDIYKK